MKWGRKASSPPSFGSSVITRVLPASWFSKFKQTGGSLDTGPGKKQQRGKLDFSTVNSSLPAGCRQARFYRLDDDAYWTLSFRKDRVGGREGRRRSSRINPLWYDSDDEFLVAVSGFREAQLPRKELETIPETDTIKMKQERSTDTVLREKRRDRLKKENIDVRRSRKLRGRVKRKNRKAELGVRLDQGDEGENESSNLEEEQVSPTQLQKADQVKEESHDSAISNSRNHQNISFQTFGWSSDGDDDEEDRVSPDLDGKGSAATSERLSTSKCQNLVNVKIEEFKKKNEEFQKEAAYISRRFRRRKVKRNRKNARGSRTESRIQVLKGKKSKKKEMESEEEAAEGSTIYNSFAVVKSSFDPQQDFRDSMVEMIQEKGIRHREELQELLACYLTLNSDRHHDLIINVFQQVWFELQLL